jgi:hypothetical protein
MGQPNSVNNSDSRKRTMTAQIVAERPTIKILLYTDDPNVISEGTNLLGLSSMIDRLKAHPPAFAKLSVKWVSRSSDSQHHADNKLDVVMAREIEETRAPFDEIWFFGLHQANTERFSLGVFRGGPESELDSREVEALEKWMKIENGSGGGVLMTGDHNNPVPPNLLPSTNGRSAGTLETPELLGLGRALGRWVPRAGALRTWEGPPSSQSNESLNTLASTEFQTDRVPQELFHERVNDAGEPDPQGQPHPLFFYQPRSFINVFPDHRHEGRLAIPDVLNKDVWPTGPTGQPKPCVVASGTDRRDGKRIDLVTAYDGDRAGVGRIVADSSWHHYVNINLMGFPHPAPANSDSDKIGQFYGNLAVWLAPIHKRRQMAQAMYLELADFTQMLEPQCEITHTGEVAYSLLERAASPCETHELLRVFESDQTAPGVSADRKSVNSVGAKKQALGAMLGACHQARIRAERATDAMKLLNPAEIISQEFLRSLSSQKLSGNGNGTCNSSVLPNASEILIPETQENQEWTIELNRESKASEAPFKAILVFKLSDQNGIVTGTVSEGIAGRSLSTVTGTHQPLAGIEARFMALDFKWGDKDIMVSGVTYKTPETEFFSGRFRALALTAVAAHAVVGDVSTFQIVPGTDPGNGDTGTATGQQT